MQAAQDITIGARLSKTQYQYTLTDADSNELNHWAAIFLEKLKRTPTASPTSPATRPMPARCST